MKQSKPIRPDGRVLAYTSRMFAKLTVAALIPLLLLATTTCGIGCELRCSLAESSVGGAKATTTGGEQSAKSSEMSKADAATPPGHCHSVALLEKPQTAVHLMFTQHAATAICPDASCSHPSILVAQLNAITIQHLGAELRSPPTSLKTGYRVRIAIEKSVFVGSPPPLTTLRI
jgi:hypothetical protein